MSIRILGTGEVVGERYAVEALIGRGGMATVYRVRHTQLDTLHALKVVSLSARSVQRRMLQEGRVQAALRHPNIVSVTDIIIVEESPGLVMEYIRGPSLEDFLEKRQLSVEQVDELALGVLAGVAAAHGHGLIHRDLKPANVMLELGADRLIPKVADFGLVKMLADESGDGDSGVKSRTRTGVTMGTPAYMAPEQIRDAKNVDVRADVFSMGAILYEMVSGHRAFEGGDVLEIFNNVADAKRVPIRERVPDVPERMELAIQGALMTEPDERIKSVNDLIAVWMGKDPTAVQSNWNMDELSAAESLGAGGEDTRQYLEKSFKSDLALTRPNLGGATGGTMPMSGAATQGVRTESTMVPEDLGGDPNATTLPPDEQHVSVPTMYPEDAAARSAAVTSEDAGGSKASVGIAVAGSMFGLVGIGIALLALVGVGLFVVFSPGSGPSTSGETDAPLTDAQPPDEPVDTPPDDPVDAPPDGPVDTPPDEPVDTTPDEPVDTTPDEPVADGQPDAVPDAPVDPPVEAPDEPDTDDADTDDGVADVVEAETPDEPEAPDVAPAPSGPSIAIETDITVVLRDDAGAQVDPLALEPGQYTVVAFFQPGRPTTVSKVTMPAGSKWRVQCNSRARRCNVEQL